MLHDAHGANNPFMAKTRLTALCYTCHTKEKVEFYKPFVHKPVEEKDCLSCHKSHASPHKDLLTESYDQLCMNCHVNMVLDLDEKNMHPVFKDCGLCHNAHASNYVAFTLKPTKELCFQCHDELKKGIAKSKNIHLPFDEGLCTECHNSHGTKLKHQLLNSPNELCLSCHQGIITTEKRTGHLKLEDGSCLSCHKPHYAALNKLLNEEDPALCSKCHSVNTEKLLMAHRQPINEISRCTSCHESHVTEGKGMLKRVRHEPFGHGKCEDCHE
jgi:predicted CXXCH cytochrome family protein